MSAEVSESILGDLSECEEIICKWVQAGWCLGRNSWLCYREREWDVLYLLVSARIIEEITKLPIIVDQDTCHLA